MIVAGFGFRSKADSESLRDAMAQVVDRHVVSAIATVSDKAHTTAFETLAKQLKLRVIAVDQSDLPKAHTQTQSTASLKVRNTGSVAEATALAAAGSGSTLLVSRKTSTDKLATCALARAAPRFSEQGETQ